MTQTIDRRSRDAIMQMLRKVADERQLSPCYGAYVAAADAVKE